MVTPMTLVTSIPSMTRRGTAAMGYAGPERDSGPPQVLLKPGKAAPLVRVPGRRQTHHGLAIGLAGIQSRQKSLNRVDASSV
jgi:hypothetical protein